MAVEDGFPPRVGGLAVAAYRICRYLADAGFEVHVATHGEDSARAIRTVDHGIHVHWIPLGETVFSRIFNLQRYLRKLDAELDFSIFHGFFLPSVAPCMAVARAAGGKRARPVIASIRGSDLAFCMSHPYFRPLLLAAFREPACWVTSVNQAYLDDLAAQVDIEGRCSVIRNGIASAAPLWQPTEENFGVVGSSGQFRKVKDIPLLVRAFRAMRAELRRRLLLVGAFTDPLEESWSRTLWQEGGLEDQVEVTGFLPHAQAISQLTRMNVYAQSSAFEGMPNALLEAASVGVPIVATAVGGVKEIFTDGKDALLVPHADPAKMTSAIERVIADPQLAGSLAQQAARLCEVYSSERERAAWVGLYGQLAGEDLDPAHRAATRESGKEEELA